MSSGSTTPVTQQTTQTRDPWSAAQPHLIETMENARGLFQSNVGYQPYSGQTQTALDPLLANALAAQEQYAANYGGGTPGVLAGQGLAADLINSQGITPGIGQSVGGLQQAGTGYQNIFNQTSGPSWAQTGYTDIYNREGGQQNPYLQGMLDTSNERINNQIASAMSGAGRYGSGMHADVAARAMAQAADPILAQDYARRMASQMQALQGIGAEDAQKRQAQLAAAGGLGSIYGQMANIYGQGLQRAGQAAELAPTLDQARLAPLQLGTAVGQYYTDRAQQQLADQIKLYNALQARPWEQLQRYTGILGGAGSQGGTQITTQPGATQPSTLQRILGGGLAGAGLGSAILPGVGTGIGALGGGLLGLLG